MAVSYAFGNRDSNLRLTGRMIAQEFISDPAEGAIEYIQVYLDRTTENPEGSVYAAILEKNPDGSPGKALAVSQPLDATDDINAAGGIVQFNFSAADAIPTNTAMFFVIAHQGPVRYTDEVALNNDLITNGALAWSGSTLTGWEILENPPNSTVTNSAPGVQLAKTVASETILPTIVQRGILETGRPYEVQITVDESLVNEYARTYLAIRTTDPSDPDGVVDWMEDPFNTVKESNCRVRFIAESPDLYITVNDIVAGSGGLPGVPGTVTQILTNVACYPTDGEFQRIVEIGADTIVPIFADGAVWIKEPGVSWAEDTGKDLVFTIEFQPTTATTQTTILSKIGAIQWSLSSPSQAGDVSTLLSVLNDIIARWESQREKVIQVNLPSQPSQANWLTRWEQLGFSAPISDGARLFWVDDSGFAGKWEARSGVAFPSGRFLKGTVDQYWTADSINLGMARTPVDEVVTVSKQGAWWVDNDLVHPTYHEYPTEFTITLHRPAYLVHRKHLNRDIIPNTVLYNFTVNGHHVLPRESLDDAAGAPPKPAWVPSGALNQGITRFINGGSLSRILPFARMFPLRLPAGTYRIRFNVYASSTASESSDLSLSLNTIVIPPSTGLAVISYSLPDIWEFIYA